MENGIEIKKELQSTDIAIFEKETGRDTLYNFLEERKVILKGITKVIPPDYYEEICFLSNKDGNDVIVHGQSELTIVGSNKLRIVSNEPIRVVEKTENDSKGYDVENEYTLNYDTLQSVEYQIFWRLEE